MADKTAFHKELFILCEGEDDAALVRALRDVRGLALEAEISPTRDLQRAGGNSAFRASLFAAEPMPGFDQVGKILLIADNDTDPESSFQALRGQVQGAVVDGATRKYGDLLKPLVVANGDPSLVAWMWPTVAEAGCLETLLWKALVSEDRKRTACVEESFVCCAVTDWDIGKIHKAYVRAYLAMTFKKNPAVTLPVVLSQSPHFLPLKHSAFDAFVDFLNAL